MKNTIIKSILDILAPNYCLSCGRVGSILCVRCKKDKLKLEPGIINGVWFLGKRTGVLRDLIDKYKFQGEREAGELLAELMAENLPVKVSKNIVVVPLPTIDKHVRARGLDHTVLLAKHLTRYRGWRVQNLLVRANDTVQVGADERTRIKQAERAYKINENLKVNPETHYLLIDDILTTGSSIMSAQRVLAGAGAKKIDLAVLAKS